MASIDSIEADKVGDLTFVTFYLRPIARTKHITFCIHDTATNVVSSYQSFCGSFEDLFLLRA